MQHDTIQFADGVAKVVQLTELQDSHPWKRALRSKCKDHRYYEIVERTLQCGFEHHYLLIQDDAGEVRAIQPVFFVRQNLVEGVRGGQGGPGEYRFVQNYVANSRTREIIYTPPPPQDVAPLMRELVDWLGAGTDHSLLNASCAASSSMTGRSLTRHGS